jgi:hypothetical protein
MRVKSPFSQSALFGFIGVLPILRSPLCSPTLGYFEENPRAGSNGILPLPIVPVLVG